MILLAIAEDEGSDVVTSGVLEVSLLPERVLRQHSVWHRTQGLDYSRLIGVPVSPEVVSTQALQTLAVLNVPGGPANLRMFMQAIERLGADQLGVSLTVATLDARSILPCQIGDLPSNVTFETPADLDCAAAAWSATATADEWAPLRAWKSQRIARLRRRERRARHAPRPKRARALFVSNPSACSGGEESLCQVIKHLDRDRCDPIALVALAGEFVDRLSAAGAHVCVPNCDFGVDTIEAYTLIAKTLDTYQPDVIHVNAPSGAPLLYAAWERGIPLVAHVRQAELQRWPSLLQAAERIITVSRYIKDRVVELDVDPAVVTVVYDGVDPTRFFPGAIDRDAARRQNVLPPDVPVLMCVARFVREKRIDLFCELIGRLRSDWPAVQGLIVGDPQAGPEVARGVRDLIDRLGLRDSVRLCGFQRDVRVALAAADVLVLCSDHEPLGTCVLEAFAMGTPAIVTRSGGLAELIDRYNAALLVPPGDLERLTDAARQVLTCPDARRRIQAGGAAAIQSECSAGAAAGRVMQILDDAIALGSAWREPAQNLSARTT